MSKIFSRFNLQFTYIKNIYSYLFSFLITKILTDFRKTVETGMDPRLDCQASYIGETGRNLSTKVTKHKRATRNGDANNHIAVHHQLTTTIY